MLSLVEVYAVLITFAYFSYLLLCLSSLFLRLSLLPMFAFIRFYLILPCSSTVFVFSLPLSFCCILCVISFDFFFFIIMSLLFLSFSWCYPLHFLILFLLILPFSSFFLLLHIPFSPIPSYPIPSFCSHVPIPSHHPSSFLQLPLRPEA